jgi:hypothetical protein
VLAARITHAKNPKHEIRNPKQIRNPKSEIQNTKPNNPKFKIQNPKGVAAKSPFSDFLFLILSRICFGFRDSDFEFCLENKGSPGEIRAEAPYGKMWLRATGSPSAASTQPPLVTTTH